jgi:hypothetical protein
MLKGKEKKKIKASELDEAFEKGSIIEHLNLKSAKVDYPVQRINIDVPVEILEKVDREAARVGVPRTSLIKVWIAEHADHLAANK